MRIRCARISRCRRLLHAFATPITPPLLPNGPYALLGGYQNKDKSSLNLASHPAEIKQICTSRDK